MSDKLIDILKITDKTPNPIQTNPTLNNLTMKAKIWKELYGFKTLKQAYATKRECEKLAKKNNIVVEFNYYGRRMHKLEHPSQGNTLCEGYDGLLDDLESIN